MISDIISICSLLLNVVLGYFTIKFGILDKKPILTAQADYDGKKGLLSVVVANKGKAVAKNVTLKIVKIYDNGEEWHNGINNLNKSFKIENVDIPPLNQIEDELIRAVPETMNSSHSFKVEISLEGEKIEKQNLKIKVNRKS
nr:MAG TPA: hypothetical protein [Siphoviridae sp. ctngg6]